MKKYKLIIFDFYKTLFNPETGELFDGIKEILTYRCARIPLILITYGGKQRKKQIKKVNIEKYFEKIIFCTKKNQETYRKILADYNASPDESIIVGDNEKEEIKIGKKLGTEIIKVNSANEKPSDTLKRRLK